MINSVQLRDFKGHRDSTVPLDRLTLLVGPNGSGKTSVLQALSLQSQLSAHEAREVLRGDASLKDLQRRGAQGPVLLSSQGVWNDAAWSSRMELVKFSVALDWRRGQETRHVPPNPGMPLRNIVPQIDKILGPAVLYKLNAERIAAAAYSDRLAPDVEYDGSDTAVVLAAIKLGYDEQFDRIEESLRQIIPNVERVRLRQAVVERPNPAVRGQLEEVVGSKIFFDFRGAPGVPAHAASEGTLITLALLTVLHGPNRPSLLLLDDFAESLHPQAQMELVRLIKRLLEEFKDVQIVATTHSPYILDELDPSQVVAFALRNDGTVALKRLSEHPQAEQMKGALSTGQLWSLDPERDWVPGEGDP
ncbi:AAA family ATPase [Sorangium sp. So ce861]|uniref:AAA family ATPase n=1 Tax=Sorangium sp. So ce861 TaxID=3133323 RepID=UPI003F5DA710